MKRKGFTLIELLAVIIILAIIALIAVPVVMNIINKARMSAFKDSAYGVIKAGELYYTERLLDPVGMETDVTFEFPNSASELPLKGQKPVAGKVKITRNGKVAIAISNELYCIRKGYNDTEVTIDENASECNLPYQDLILNGADPEIKTGMIPVNIASDGTVTKANTESVWYNYANKEWANVVTVKASGTKTREYYMNATAGTSIAEEDILTYLVWIPRYKYKLWNVEVVDGSTSLDSSKVHSINIVFEDKNTTRADGNENGEYLTHPAFTFWEVEESPNELNGIWVGKFETGYAGATSKSEAQVNTANSSKVIIKPNTYSWRRINVSNIFNTVKDMNEENNAFGLNGTSDTHTMKNMEWGAVAYLSHSQYGKDGEIYINNANTYTTGCGGKTASATSASTCDNAYGSKSDGIYNQSTTGNISGIFDMSGGAYEYAMGYTTGASTVYGLSDFNASTFPGDKYVDVYNSTSNSQYTERKLGDATGEIGPFSSYLGSWYQELAYFPNSSNPWFLRGGYYADNTCAGIFYFNVSNGNTYDYVGFRVVIL